MIDVLLQVLLEIWEILKEASVFLLFGFLVAGTLAVLVPKGPVHQASRHRQSEVGALGLGDRDSAAALLLRRSPDRAWIAPSGRDPRRNRCLPHRHPETGVDSISLTYALTDPILTIVRPLAGIVTAISAGFATNFFGVARARVEHGHAPPQAPANG